MADATRLSHRAVGIEHLRGESYSIVCEGNGGRIGHGVFLVGYHPDDRIALVAGGSVESVDDDFRRWLANVFVVFASQRFRCQTRIGPEFQDLDGRLTRDRFF